MIRVKRSLPAGQRGLIGVAAFAAACGAVAIGAMAIGSLAIGSLAIGRARIGRLEIDELVVGKIGLLRKRREVPTQPSGSSMANFWNLCASHFNVLKGCEAEKHAWRAWIPAEWASQVVSEISIKLPKEHASREDLYRICALDSGFSGEDVFICTMSWGGMRRDHGRRAWGQRNDWRPIIAALRHGQMDRREAYDAFLKANVSGLGPAYFTKLIYFCLPSHNGYILDQWIGRSINLLFEGPNGEKPIHMRRRWVTRNNTAENYDAFCGLMEELAAKLQCSPSETEKKLFSTGGRRAGQWRQHVRNS
jgi:hypothetical protein